MAKEKTEKKQLTGEERAALLQKEIEKEFGSVMLSPDDIISKDYDIIPVSPALDLGLSGGIPVGSWFTLSGKQKCGKTTICLQICKNFQKMSPDNYVYYFDVENRIKVKNLAYLGIEDKRMKITQSTVDKILSAEDFLNMILKTIRTHPGSLIVVDSLSAISTKGELEGGVGTEERGRGQKYVAQFCREVAQLLRPSNCTLLVITHIMANTSGYGKATLEKSGNAAKYQMDAKIFAKTTSNWEVTANSVTKSIGQITEWLVEESALGGNNVIAKSYHRYGSGIDETMELVEIGTELGLIAKGGSWFQLAFLGEDGPKLQGMQNVYNYLLEHTEEKDKLYKQIIELTS